MSARLAVAPACDNRAGASRDARRRSRTAPGSAARPPSSNRADSSPHRRSARPKAPRAGRAGASPGGSRERRRRTRNADRPGKDSRRRSSRPAAPPTPGRPAPSRAVPDGSRATPGRPSRRRSRTWRPSRKGHRARGPSATQLAAGKGRSSSGGTTLGTIADRSQGGSRSDGPNGQLCVDVRWIISSAVASTRSHRPRSSRRARGTTISPTACNMNRCWVR